jgi:hypothetical protein
MKILPVCAVLLLIAAIAAPAFAEPPVDTTVNLSTLPSCNSDSEAAARFVDGNQFGVSVQNLHHHNIFRFDSRKAPWRPISGFRETLCGRVAKYYVATEHPDQSEYDWNIDVTPAAAFAPSMGAGTVECEITPAVPLRTNELFPPKGSGRPSLLLGKDICVYGPWVKDLGHHDQREIHPAEAIWWRDLSDSSGMDVLLIQDAAIHRFTELADYDFDEDHDGHPDSNPRWAPWVQYPHMEEVKIPFRYDPSTGRYLVLGIETPRAVRVVTHLFSELADSDNGSNHRLKTVSARPVAVRQQILAEVNETIGQFTGVQFGDLCRAADGVVNGNIRVLVALGRPDTRDAGYVLLRFKKSSGTNGPVVHQ